jgi:hypothetical protein
MRVFGYGNVRPRIPKAIPLRVEALGLFQLRSGATKAKVVLASDNAN